MTIPGAPEMEEAREELVPPPPPSDRRHLDRSLVKGIAWTAAVKWVVQLTTWLGTLVVATLLTPDEYGIAGTAMLYIVFVQMINEFGLSAAVVQRRDLTEDQIARLGGMSILMGCGFALLSLLLAGPVALVFHIPEVRAVVMVLSVIFVTSGLQVLPRSLLTRDLRFRTLAFIEATEAAVSTVATIILAWLGYSYWALVFGGIIGRVTSTIMTLGARGHRVAWPSPFASIAPLVTFGSHILVATIAWYAFRNADQLFVSRQLGKGALGGYDMALTLASIPVDRVAAVLMRATPAIFASVQHEVASLRRYLLLLTEAISIVAFPAAVGLALVAADIIGLIGKDEWAPAINPLRVLALAAIVRALTPVMNQLLVATGQSRRNMQATLVGAVLLPPLYWIATHWGITAVAAVWLVAYPVTAAFFVYYGLRTCELPLSAYLRTMRPAVFGTAIMTLAVLAVGYLIPEGAPPAAYLIVKCGTGVAAYAGALLALEGRRMWSFATELRALIK